MKRTKKPFGRRKILGQDIDLDLREKNGSPDQIVVKLSGVDKYGFPDSARISLEISNADAHSQIAHLGDVGFLSDSFTQDVDLDGAFVESDRQAIRCNLRVVDPGDSRLLGFAEKLRMKGGQESLLVIEMCDDMRSVFELDWSNYDSLHDSLVLRCNNEIDRKAWDAIYPLVAESLYREILIRILIESNDMGDDDDELIENEWIKLAGPDSIRLVEARSNNDISELYAVVSEVARKFAINRKLVKQTKKGISDLKK